MSQCCNKFIFDDTPDTFQMWQGLRGPYFTPHVAENGDLSWSNNGQMTNPETVNIKGPPGPGGAPGGTTGQLLAKTSDEDYDTEWIDPPDLDAGHVEYDPAEAYDDGSVGKELTTINSALSSLSSVTEIIDTASGAIASFPDGSGLPMRSLLATIEPQQDLHGYANPWPAGGGKNKLPPFTDGLVNNNTTLHVNENGSLYFTGTEDGGGAKTFSQNITLPAGTYIASGSPSGGSQGHYDIYVQVGGAVVARSYNGSEGQFTLSAESVVTFGVRAETGTIDSTKVFYPLLRLSGTDSTYAPYSNECPISGWTGLSGQRTGVNQWDEEVESGYISADGSLKANAISLRSKNFCPCKGNVEYRFVRPSSYSVTPNICWYDKNQTFISRTGTSGFPLLTSPDNASFFKISMWEYGTTYNHDVSINYPSTETSYHAYTSLPITVSWQTEAGTVYDGYIDVVSGLLTVDTAVETENGGNPYWQLNTGGVGRFYLPSLPSGLDTSRKAESICNVLTYKDDNTVYGSFFVYGGSGLYVNKISADETLEQFKTRISNPAIQIIYPLATPQTYQLTPQQISTLLGNNTVFVDTGSVSVTYQASIKGYIDKVLGA